MGPALGCAVGAAEIKVIGLSLGDDVGAPDGIFVTGTFDGGDVLVIGIPPRLVVGDTVLLVGDGTGVTITPDVIVGLAVTTGAMIGAVVVMDVGATVSPALLNKSSFSPPPSVAL